MMQWVPPFRVEVEWLGTRFGDIVFSSTPELLVSEKFAEVYNRAQLSGFVGFEPVEIVSINKKRNNSLIGAAPKYYHVRPCIGTAMIDDHASGLVRTGVQVCLDCSSGGTGERFERVVLHANTWSGEDVFFARGLPGTILVSAPFKETFGATQFENVLFVAATNYHCSINDLIE
jgi:hypothetical protein